MKTIFAFCMTHLIFSCRGHQVLMRTPKPTFGNFNQQQSQTDAPMDYGCPERRGNSLHCTAEIGDLFVLNTYKGQLCIEMIEYSIKIIEPSPPALFNKWLHLFSGLFFCSSQWLSKLGPILGQIKCFASMQFWNKSSWLFLRSLRSKEATISRSGNLSLTFFQN